MAGTNYWTRYSNQRLTRRRVLGSGAVAGAGAAGLALVGCGDNDTAADAPSATATTGAQQPTAVPGEPTATSTPVPTPTTPPPEKIRKEGVLELRHSTIYASINPYKGLDSGALWGFTIFDHLFGVPLDTLEPELMLGVNLEQPNPQTIIVTVGEAFFHDKAPADGRRILAGRYQSQLRSSLGGAGYLLERLLDGVL